MRLSEILGRTVADQGGAPIGVVHDLRARVAANGDWRITGLAVASDDLRSKAALRWGYAEGRATGPWVLRRLMAKQSAAARFVPAELVTDWGADPIRIKSDFASLVALDDVVHR